MTEFLKPTLQKKPYVLGKKIYLGNLEIFVQNAKFAIHPSILRIKRWIIEDLLAKTSGFGYIMFLK